MDNSNPHESPKEDAMTLDVGMRISHMGDNSFPTLDTVLKWASVGACCSAVALVLSVVIVFSRGHFADEDVPIAMQVMVFYVILLVPIGAVTGAIVGFFLRNRNERDEPPNTNLPSLPP